MIVKKQLKSLLITLFARLPFQVVRRETVDASRLILGKADSSLVFIASAPKHQHGGLLAKLDYSQSQIAQDLFVLSTLNFLHRGFFVEIGATNGLDLSNTWLLEKHFDWQGIVAEPARVWRSSLIQNRDCHLEFSCLFSKSGLELDFLEHDSPELSGLIRKIAALPTRSKKIQNNRVYKVPTISLFDLLKKYSAPYRVDYLSIDTEGSEFEILKDFDFSSYRFSVITCEHNYGANRNKIHELLTSKGYRRVMVGLSKWDDWYVDPSVLNILN